MYLRSGASRTRRLWRSITGRAQTAVKEDVPTKVQMCITVWECSRGAIESMDSLMNRLSAAKPENHTHEQAPDAQAKARWLRAAMGGGGGQRYGSNNDTHG
eukprot:TRINITY_DN49556_c0_g1_i1.p3 TRINITY_DN49556_c0_g1~~TRINITY_DN49556_c0_g1_i1.p3  ORF type:complete len:101 (-),score=20.65 TRINITY_DN49556_c0_g1_i1:29-331(-)